MDSVAQLAYDERADLFTVTSYAAELFPDLFQMPSTEVNTLAAERTFWEKVTLLHSEYHRPRVKPLSRHYYDVAMLARTEIKDLLITPTCRI